MTTIDNVPATPLARTVRLFFRTTAIVEAVSWLGMLTALVVKYPLQGSPLGVTIWGWVHGIVWIAFVVATVVAAIFFRWPWWSVPLGFVMSIVPFLTIPFDIWMERSGRLRTGWRERRRARITSTA